MLKSMQWYIFEKECHIIGYSIFSNTLLLVLIIQLGDIQNFYYHEINYTLVDKYI